jgi:hypothetical protein
MGGACSKHGADEKFYQEIWKEEISSEGRSVSGTMAVN